MAALADVVPLLRPQAFTHVEIMMLVWPQRDTPMWRVILEQEAIASDLHRAAAEVSTAYGERLRTVLLSGAESVHVSIVDADTVPAVHKAIADHHADLAFLVVGPAAPESQVAANLRTILSEAAVPIWLLHAPVHR